MRNTIYYYGFLFILGGFGYCFLELLWRGYTDFSMGVAGGISFCILALIQKHFKPLKFIYRCILGGLSISTVELLFGVVFNLYLNRAVWDYSQMPFNIMGQVCLSFTVMWCFLSAPMLIIADLLREKLTNRRESVS